MVNGGGQMCSFAVYITCVGLEAVCVKTTENCSSEQRLVKFKVKQEILLRLETAEIFRPGGYLL